LTGPNFDQLDIGGDAKAKQVNFRQQKWEYLAVLIAGNANVERGMKTSSTVQTGRS